MNPRRFSNKVCIITGSGSGIGRASAQLFAAEGASVMVLDTEKIGRAETIELIKIQNGVALFCKCDVRSEDEIKNGVSLIMNTWK